MEQFHECNVKLYCLFFIQLNHVCERANKTCSNLGLRFIYLTRFPSSFICRIRLLFIYRIGGRRFWTWNCSMSLIHLFVEVWDSFSIFFSLPLKSIIDWNIHWLLSTHIQQEYFSIKTLLLIVLFQFMVQYIYAKKYYIFNSYNNYCK